MSSWEVNIKKDFTCEKPVFIEGLPGIGNVGKIVIDYLIELTKATKVASFFSYDLPNSVFVNEKNMIQMPSIELHHVNIKNQDYLFLTGDAQPAQERASFELTVRLLDLIRSYKCKEIITLGGIGLNEVPESPSVFVTGNTKTYMNEFKKLGADPNIFGVVGPIVGVSGLLIGMSKKYRIKGVALLGETFGHPMYIGLKEAKKILMLLDKKFTFKLDLSELDDEIEAVDEEIKAIQADGDPTARKKSKKLGKLKKYQDLSYIG